MQNKKRYFSIPSSIIEEQKKNALVRDLYFTEIGELEIEGGKIWSSNLDCESFLLVYCIKGNGIVLFLDEQLPIADDQFVIVPIAGEFKYYSVLNVNTKLLIACFNGRKAKQMGKDFSVVRNLIPSVNNRVANRELLFDEIFINLAKGFDTETLEYVNFCFTHLLATFIYAYKTSDDIADESNPVIRKAINYLGRNLDKKLLLTQLANEVGYSPSYFITLFKKETNYSPIAYFSHLKIVKACELLDYTNMKVKEISFCLGYSDPYYFTKDFTKKMGLSPRNYRNRLNLNLNNSS